MEPLASRLRPHAIGEVIGQKHLVGEGRILSAMMDKARLLNMIFYGPPGTGKTTMARLLADLTDREIHMLNASTDSLKDVREVLESLNTMMGAKGIILYIDEIHLFNKRNQQVLLDYIEDGRVILIGSTTENPHFAVFKALVSRCLIVEFKPLNAREIREGLDRGIAVLKEENGLKDLTYDSELLNFIAQRAGGDMRRALNQLEVLFLASFRTGEATLTIKKAEAEELLGQKIMDYDADGDRHFDLLSAFHKSVRGSDPDAAIAYLTLMLKGGDLMAISRRLLCIASEDIGLAYPQAIVITKACVDSALQLGLPEAMLPLANATILLATSPKSNSAPSAVWRAQEVIENKEVGDIPSYLRDGHYAGAGSLGRAQGYQYPHSFPGHYVQQEYLPTGLATEVFYEFGDNKLEQASKAYWDVRKGQKKAKDASKSKK